MINIEEGVQQLGNNLQTELSGRGITRKDIQLLLEVSRQSISNIMLGKKTLSIDKLLLVCSEYNISMDKILAF